MASRSWLLVAALAGSLAAAGWLFVENRALRTELDELQGARDQASAPVTAQAAAIVPDRTVDEPRTVIQATSEPAPERFDDVRTRPTPPEEPAEETREARRKRRQAEIAAMFGRLDDETADEYRERMVPFVQMALARPRTRLQDARRAAEDAAGVSDDQRTELDAAFQDAYSEALALTNRAIESGDLTPYERNWSGMLHVAGGLGAVLEDTEARIGNILTPAQMGIIYDQGFEWGEYLGASVPWENLEPPPPPPPPGT